MSNEERKDKFGLTLKVLADKSGKNYKQIARQLDMPYSSFRKCWDRKHRQFPGVNEILTMCNYFNVQPNTLLGFEGGAVQEIGQLGLEAATMLEKVDASAQRLCLDLFREDCARIGQLASQLRMRETPVAIGEVPPEGRFLVSIKIAPKK